MVFAKKVSSIIFSLVLVAGLLPCSAFADAKAGDGVGSSQVGISENEEATSSNDVSVDEPAKVETSPSDDEVDASSGREGETAGASSSNVPIPEGPASEASLLAENPAQNNNVSEITDACTVSYSTHVQDIGWQDWAKDGAMAGTSGRSKRLEAIKIKLGESVDGGISYSTHIQDIGWQAEKANGELSGTEGQSKRLEAVKIRLTGNVAQGHSVWYRVHAQDYGWLGWAKDGEKAGTEGYSKRLEAIEVVVLPEGESPEGYSATESAFKAVEVGYTSHVQDYGDIAGSSDSLTKQLSLGVTGKSKRLEAFSLTLGKYVDGGISYCTHIQDIGWQAEKANGELSGTEGQSKRLEAVKISLTGNVAEGHSVWYRVHAQDYGWLGWAKDGEKAGTEGLSKRLEAVQVIILPAGQTPSDYSESEVAYKHNCIDYSSHVANVGSVSGATDSLAGHVVFGTTGQSHSLEGFAIGLSDLVADYSGSIEYRAHVQDVGWQSWMKDGSFAGTKGQSKRVEAAEFKLSGDLSEKYDIYYRAHVSNIGWMAWAKNGESAVGSVGCSIPVEAVEVTLVPKGSTDAPSTDGLALLDSSAFPSLNCGSQSSGWGWGYADDGNVAGTVGQGRPLAGMSLAVSSSKAISGGVQYQAHFANAGWTGWAGNGVQATSGGNAIQAFKIQLSGDLSRYFDVYYRAHISGYGWMGWTKNGAPAGTTGLNINVEAYQVQIVAKGAPAPGSTAQSFSDENGFLGIAPDQRAMRNRIAYEDSRTEWLIGVDRSSHKVGVFRGSAGNWRIQYWWDCVTGAPGTPTITGSFYTTGGKRGSLDTDSRAIYCTQIWGGYFFHSVLSSESELGQSLSHGCIRMGWSSANWIYNNIWAGTKVVIYN